MKSPNAAAAFASTTDENYAAALSVLGIPTFIDKSTDVKSGMAWKKIMFQDESVIEEGGGGQPVKTSDILPKLQDGRLAQENPIHPSVDVVRACRAADALVAWTRDGKERSLAKVKGADRYMLIERPIEPSVKAGAATVSTGDLKLAACLCVLGCQPLRIEGTPPTSRFIFGAAGYGSLPVIPSDLSVAYRTKRLLEIDPQHPLLWMMQGLSNRDGIRDMMHKKASILLIRAPGTGRASLISENAKGSTRDRVKKHLRIT